MWNVSMLDQVLQVQSLLQSLLHWIVLIRVTQCPHYWFLGTPEISFRNYFCLFISVLLLNRQVRVQIPVVVVS